MKTINLLLLSFFLATTCSAQVNEFICIATRNEWKFVLQLRADSVFKYEAFSKFGRWDLLLGRYEVKKNRLSLKNVSPEEEERLAATWGEEEKHLIMTSNDTLANGEIVKKSEPIKISSTILVSWNIASTRSSFFIIKNDRLYQRPEKSWPKMDPYFSRTDGAAFDFRKLFL